MHRSAHLYNIVILLSVPLLMRCGGSEGSGPRNNSGGSGEAGTASTTTGGRDSVAGGSASGGATNMGGAMNMAGSGMMNMGGAAMATGGNTGTTVAGPQAPIMESVSSMSGMHVVWTNVTPNCDKIELLRNKDGGAFALTYTLTGAATSQHDGSAMPPGTYCYKARCVLGTETSAESNEKCGTS